MHYNKDISITNYRSDTGLISLPILILNPLTVEGELLPGEHQMYESGVKPRLDDMRTVILL